MTQPLPPRRNREMRPDAPRSVSFLARRSAAGVRRTALAGALLVCAAGVPANAAVRPGWVVDGWPTALAAGRGVVYVGGAFDYAARRTGPAALLDAATAAGRPFPEVSGGRAPADMDP